MKHLAAYLGIAMFLSPLSYSPVIAQAAAPAMSEQTKATVIPPEFKDPQTGLRVVHLSRYPTDYGSVIYFTYNTFTPDSRYTLVNDQMEGRWRYLYSFDFQTMTVKPLEVARKTQDQVVTKSGNVYYMADNAAWVVPLAGGQPRKIADIPPKWCPGYGFTVNADETLILSGAADVDQDPPAQSAGKAAPRVLYTINIKTGQLKVVHRDNKQFGHVQFSPTDPDLCMFCWEGNWAKVDRIWFINPSKSTVDTNGNVTSNAHIAYHRTEPGEIVGHEFWQPDGKKVWFQQSFKSPARSFLTCMDVISGTTTQYKIPSGYGGIHETFSPDGSFLIADGNGHRGDRKPAAGKYISMLMIPTDGSDMLRGKHLVTMFANDYAFEPNPHVSLDNHWVTFTATLNGTPQAYAVELSPEISGK